MAFRPKQVYSLGEYLEFNNMADTVELRSVPCAIPLSAIYRDVTFPEPAENENKIR